MKINEITEGLLGQFGKYLGASAADQIGARRFASFLRGNMFGSDRPDLFSDPAKVQRVLDVLTQMQSAKGQRLTNPEVDDILQTKLPKAWYGLGVKDEVLKSIMAALKTAPIRTKTASPATSASVQKADESISVGGEIIEPSDPLYKQLKAKMAGK